MAKWPKCVSSAYGNVAEVRFVLPLAGPKCVLMCLGRGINYTHVPNSHFLLHLSVPRKPCLSHFNLSHPIRPTTQDAILSKFVHSFSPATHITTILGSHYTCQHNSSTQSKSNKATFLHLANLQVSFNAACGLGPGPNPPWWRGGAARMGPRVQMLPRVPEGVMIRPKSHRIVIRTT